MKQTGRTVNQTEIYIKTRDEPRVCLGGISSASEPEERAVKQESSEYKWLIFEGLTRNRRQISGRPTGVSQKDVCVVDDMAREEDDEWATHLQGER